METKFWPAWEALKTGDQRALRRRLTDDPSLARERSNVGHPTLLQALILDGVDLDPDVQVAMAQALIEHGSPINEPFVSTGSLNNVVLAEFLVAQGAPIDGDPTVMRGWSALEEALYWGNYKTAKRLIELGARVRNLRIAAGLGDRDRVQGFFEDGQLVPSAGNTNYPFSNSEPEQVTSNPQDVIDNAVIYAVAGNHRDVVADLLSFGAAINALPLGFHVRGSALHFAAMNGHGTLCDFLIERGADPGLADGSEDRRPPAAWATYGGHEVLAQELSSKADL